MVRSDRQAGGSRDARPTGPVARLFGRAHSVPTATVLPEIPVPQHPASMQADFGTLFDGAVELRAASIRGLSHRGEPAHARQDAYAYTVRGDRLYIAVADGVGSAPHSHIGARAATRTAIALMTSGVASPKWLGHAVAAQIEAEARAVDVPAAALATTLVVAVVRRGIADEPWEVAVTEWGDSRASIFAPGVAVAGHPSWRHVCDDEDAVLVNDVAALPIHRRPTALGRTVLMPGEVLVVASDGVDGPLRPENHVGHGLADAWGTVPGIAQFIADVDFERVGARDDRTVVAAFRAPREAG